MPQDQMRIWNKAACARPKDQEDLKFLRQIAP